LAILYILFSLSEVVKHGGLEFPTTRKRRFKSFPTGGTLDCSVVADSSTLRTRRTEVSRFSRWLLSSLAAVDNLVQQLTVDPHFLIVSLKASSSLNPPALFLLF
jgi:hypothetical protein